MGNFSRKPDELAAHALEKRYVGVRLQQAVPLLDADWNLLDDLRRLDLETFGRVYIGSGVPVGSDGFHIVATATPNDFTIRAGRCLVEGKGVEIDADYTYTTQPNFAKLGLPTLVAPPFDTAFVVVLDVWDREANSDEDSLMIDARIGIETTIRLKREWAVRVVATPFDPATLAEPGHRYLQIALLRRQANNNGITAAMIEDLRDTGMSVLRKINVVTLAGQVDNARFRRMLENTRDQIHKFVIYISTGFNPPISSLLSAEILGLQMAGHVAATAEAGLAQINSLSMSNTGALRYLRQLHAAEQNFLSVWRDIIVPNIGTPSRKYTTYAWRFAELAALLNDPVINSLKGLLPSIEADDLLSAVTTQEFFAARIAAAAGNITRGSIVVTYAGGPNSSLTIGQHARFEFRIRSFTTQADTYTVTIGPPAGWPRTLVNAQNIPIPDNKITLGASGSQTSVFVDVIVQAGTSNLQVQAESLSNPTEVKQTSGLLVLTAGEMPPLSEERIILQIENPSGITINPATGVAVVKRPPSVQPGSVAVRIFNNTGKAASFDVTAEVAPGTAIGTGWTITRAGDPKTSDIPNGGNIRHDGFKVAVGPASMSAVARFRVSANLNGVPVVSEILLPITAED